MNNPEPFSIIIKSDVMLVSAIIQTQDEYDELAMAMAIAGTGFFRRAASAIEARPTPVATIPHTYKEGD